MPSVLVEAESAFWMLAPRHEPFQPTPEEFVLDQTLAGDASVDTLGTDKVSPLKVFEGGRIATRL